MITTTTKKLIGITAAAGLLLALAGCGSAPETAPSATADGSDVVEGFLPCIVSGTGGFEDKSFNQLGLQGITKAAADLGDIDFKKVASNTTSDFAPNIQSMLDQNCTLIVTVGFDLAAPTVAAATANPDVQFVLIDDMGDTDFNGETDAPNIKPVIFDTSQAAFLAGYASASYTKTKKVGTFGGKPFPTVTIFMDGFKQGVDYWNEQKSDSVEVKGWDGTDGTFVNVFVAGAEASAAAKDLLGPANDVDVLLPVGGGIYQSAASEIRASGKDAALLGVDADVFETDPSVGDLLLTSIMKGVDVGVEESVKQAAAGEFDATPFIGTLENGGVGIAPFHDFESKVSPDLQGELDAIKAGIIDGSIPVTSYLN